MFNTKEFSWADVQVVMFGRIVTRLRGVKYTVKKDKEYLHATGDTPFAIQAGNKEYEGEIMVLQSEIEAMQSTLASTEDITDIPPFNIVISYVPKSGGTIITHSLNGCEFTEDMREMDQGKKYQELTLPIMFLERKAI